MTGGHKAVAASCAKAKPVFLMPKGRYAEQLNISTGFYKTV